MYVSLNHLKEYINLDDIDIKEICDRLTMTGTKVEKYIKFGRKVDKVVTGKIVAIERHPMNNQLKKVTVSIGIGTYTVVANIPDLEEGQIIPLALAGADILNKEVKVQEIDNVTSNAMICHINDLGLTKELYPAVNSSGLITFPSSIELGKDINEVLGLEDYIIEFEITPNRPDCLSVEGIVRELSATFSLPIIKELWQDKKIEYSAVESKDKITVNVESQNCKRYVLNTANNVNIKQTPFDIQIKLIKSGFNIINNIVDITNFVMLEIGQPLHAFDLDDIGNNILVREAKENEEIEVLDNTTKVLTNDMMVIANNKKAIAVAGIMGGTESGINDKTKKIAFEAATFVRGSVRNTAKKLSLRTDASSRYEKGLSSRFVIPAMARVVDLMNSLDIAKMNLEVIDIDKSSFIDSKLIIDYDKINSVIGLDLDMQEIDNILNSLNINVDIGIVSIPYYRQDITIIEDLAEEVARIYGYDKLLSTLPKTEETLAKFTDMQKFEIELKNICMVKEFNEIYTYSFFSENTLKKATLGRESKLNDLVKLSNPLSIDFEYMRSTTIPHMLEALEINYTKKNTNVKLFEFGKVFLDAKNIEKNELVTEKNVISLGVYGDNIDFYYIKNIVMSIINKYKLNTNIARSLNIILHPGMSADILVNNKIIASFGKVNPKVIVNYELPENTYIAEINVEELFLNKVNMFKYEELPKFPAVERDLALVADDKILSGDLITEMKSVSELVEDVKVFDVYKGNQIGENKKSIAYKILLRDKTKTLDEKDIKSVIENILVVLKDKFDVTIRS